MVACWAVMMVDKRVVQKVVLKAEMLAALWVEMRAEKRAVQKVVVKVEKMVETMAVYLAVM